MKLKNCTLHPTIKELVENAKISIERYAELAPSEMGNGKSQVMSYISQIYVAKSQMESTAKEK